MSQEPNRQDKSTVNIPESWKVSEEEAKNIWDKKSQMFSYFKERFKKKPTSE